MVTQYYRPEDAKIPNGLAAALVARGHSVRVITGYPNYPTGRIFPGFRQRLRHHEMDGRVAVRRVPLVISHSQSALGRVASYMSFALSSLVAGRFANGADVVYVYATQMTAAIAPHWWRKSRKLPFVLHVQDLWPESITGSSMVGNRLAKQLITKFVSVWAKRVYRDAAGIIAIAPGMREMLIRRGGDPRSAHTVPNWADEDSIGQSGSNRDGRQSGLTVTYAGSLGYLQDLHIAIEAARRVADLPDFRLVIVGSGVAEESLVIAADGMANVSFEGRVPITEMHRIYDESDFQLITLKNMPIFRGTIPSKLQGSLAAGVPVISNVAGDANRLIVEESVGFTAEPNSPDSLAEAFRAAYALSRTERAAMGGRAKRYYDAEMSMHRGVDAIERILAQAASTSTTRGDLHDQQSL